MILQLNFRNGEAKVSLWNLATPPTNHDNTISLFILFSVWKHNFIPLRNKAHFI